MAPALSAGTPIRAHRKQCHAPRYLPSQHDSDLPTRLMTLIDLPCTPEVPGIHLPWTCAATGQAPSDPAALSRAAAISPTAARSCG